MIPRVFVKDSSFLNSRGPSCLNFSTYIPEVWSRGRCTFLLAFIFVHMLLSSKGNHNFHLTSFFLTCSMPPHYRTIENHTLDDSLIEMIVQVIPMCVWYFPDLMRRWPFRKPPTSPNVHRFRSILKCSVTDVMCSFSAAYSAHSMHVSFRGSIQIFNALSCSTCLLWLWCPLTMSVWGELCLMYFDVIIFSLGLCLSRCIMYMGFIVLIYDLMIIAYHLSCIL